MHLHIYFDRCDHAVGCLELSTLDDKSSYTGKSSRCNVIFEIFCRESAREGKKRISKMAFTLVFEVYLTKNKQSRLKRKKMLECIKIH